MREYTHKELSDAFDRVKNFVDWKGPIDALIPAADKDIVKEAIIYFTATIPEFISLKDDTRFETNKANEHMWFRVVSEGYRLGPAGDH